MSGNIELDSFTDVEVVNGKVMVKRKEGNLVQTMYFSLGELNEMLELLKDSDEITSMAEDVEKNKEMYQALADE